MRTHTKRLKRKGTTRKRKYHGTKYHGGQAEQENPSKPPEPQNLTASDKIAESAANITGNLTRTGLGLIGLSSAKPEETADPATNQLMQQYSQYKTTAENALSNQHLSQMANEQLAKSKARIAELTGKLSSAIDKQAISQQLEKAKQEADKLAGDISKGDFTSMKQLANDQYQVAKEKMSKLKQMIDEKTNGKLSQAASYASGVAASAIDGVTNLISSPTTTETVGEATEKLVDSTKELLETANKKMEDPQFQEDLKKASENAARASTIVLSAMDKPIEKATEQAKKITEETIVTGTRAATKAVFGFASAIPYLGSFFSLGNTVNSLAEAGSSLVGSAAKSAEITNKLLAETSENVDEAKKELDEANAAQQQLKQQGGAIFKRLNKTLRAFENPKIKNPTIIRGGRRQRHNFTAKHTKTS